MIQAPCPETQITSSALSRRIAVAFFLFLFAGGCAHQAPVSHVFTPTLLVMAVEEGDREAVERLLAAGADPNDPDRYGYTPLHKAAEAGEIEIMQALLAAGVFVDALNVGGGMPEFAKENQGQTPFHRAAAAGQAEAVRVLREHGADPNARDDMGKFPLLLGAQSGSFETVRSILAAGAGPLLDKSYGTHMVEPYAAGRDRIEVNQALQRLVRVLDIVKRDSDADYVQAAIANNPGLNETNRLGPRILLRAMREGLGGIVGFTTELLHGSGVDTSVRRGEGKSISGLLDPGTSETIQALLEASADLDSRDEAGGTQLHAAVDNRVSAHDLVRLLDSDRIDLNARDGEGRTPLHIAVGLLNYYAVEALLSLGADFEAKDDRGATPLHLAARGNSEYLVSSLLSAGADPNSRNRYGQSALHEIANASTGVPVIETLLAAGADPNLMDYAGRTPIYKAIVKGDHPGFGGFMRYAQRNMRDPAAIDALIAGGADPYLKDFRGISQLQHAASTFGNYIAAVFSEMLAVQAKPHFIGNLVWIGHLAIEDQAPALARSALARETGADVAEVATSLLHLAAYNGADGIVDILLAAGANPNVRDKHGRTPLHWAARKAHPATVESLLDAGAEPDSADRYRHTPLHQAVDETQWAEQEKIERCVELLLAAGADPNRKDRSGVTPLHQAVWNDNPGVAKQLIAAGADEHLGAIGAQ